MDSVSLLLVLGSTVLTFFAVLIGVIRIIPACDALASWRLGELTTQANALALGSAQLEKWLRFWCFSMCAAPAVLYLSDAWILGVASVFFIYVSPEHIMRYLIIRRRTLLRDQLVVAIQGLANTAQAGLTLHQGLAEIAREVPNPLSRELQRINADYERGRPLPEALEEVRQRLKLESFTLFATAIQISLERGGRINEALARIANSLRDHQRVERKMEADTASGRREVLVMALFPVIFGLMMLCMDNKSTQLLFTTFGGQVVICVITAMVYAGSRWALKMIDIER